MLLVLGATGELQRPRVLARLQAQPPELAAP